MKWKTLDPKMGLLHFDVTWKRRLTLPPIGKVLLLVIPEDEPIPTSLPAEWQRELFELIREKMPEMYPRIEDAMWSYCVRFRENIDSLDWSYPESSREAIELLTRETFRESLANPEVIIEGDSSLEHGWKLEFQCEWDDCQGVRVAMDGMQILEIGRRW